MLKEERHHCIIDQLRRKGKILVETATPCIVGPLSALTYLITNSSIDETVLALYRQQGVSIVQADI